MNLTIVDRYCTQGKLKFLTSIMMWGSMCGQGIGAFTTVNEFTVIDVLEHFFFIPSIENYIGDDVIFQDDNASCRRANQVKSFLQSWSINILVWKPNSPDLNPIENVWCWVSWKETGWIFQIGPGPKERLKFWPSPAQNEI